MHRLLILLFLFLPKIGIAQRIPPKIHTTAYGADSIGGQHIQMQHYYLTATSEDSLHKEIEAERMKDTTIKHFMACTKTQVNWNWEVGLRQSRIRFDYLETYPPNCDKVSTVEST